MGHIGIDKTILDLLSLLIGGAGIFAVLTKYAVPQVNHSFWDSNPYSIKRDIIEKVMSWLFVILALDGLVIQAYVAIKGDAINNRLYEVSFYTTVFCTGLVVMGIFVFFLAFVGRAIAKKIWFPIIIDKYRKGYAEVVEIIKNCSLYEEDLDENQVEHYENRKEFLLLIEDLLELKKTPRNIREKYQNLQKYFQEP